MTFYMFHQIDSCMALQDNVVIADAIAQQILTLDCDSELHSYRCGVTYGSTAIRSNVWNNYISGMIIKF